MNLITDSKGIQKISLWLFVFIIQFILIVSLKSASESLERATVNTIYFLIIYLCTKNIINEFQQTIWKKKVLTKFILLILVTGISRSLIEIYYFKNAIFNFEINEDSSFILKSSVYAFSIFAMLIASIISGLTIFFKKKISIEKENLVLQSKILETEIQILNNQFSPHFLFNGINDLYSASILDKEKTPEMILKLGEILKFVTYQLKNKEIYISEEIKQIKIQLDYFELRNNFKIPITIKIAEDVNSVKVAPFLIIPLVENALKHGNFNDIYAKTFLGIEISKKENQLTICVENSYQKIDNTDILNTDGIGIENYKKRLVLLYGNKHQLEIIQKENNFKSTLEVNLSK